ncbi:proteasome inhibitor PI31 subunit [Cavenderia fasciculata]|uniref:Proteasome inhibitor PI31 subunit n=1 Tax=Cavenderia fasciculata TaxID=261658 RepID=F4PLC6_CACFS|nr:proteasome inhibitor PI31 subunit [Cavenderia fasciculata]EGG23348.1 proteasome inhibitor PI31 subunit [Cavenderia fasciculata]|eukprot:XP_004361199.1 proteasome inhibitor PI31 subunit [Cavenderia fasciculata]
MEFKENILKILNQQPSNQDVKSIRDEFDLTVYTLHLLTCMLGYKCIGITEKSKSNSSNNNNNNEEDTMKLPNGWNSSNDSYCLFYQSNSDPSVTFIIKSLRMGDTLILNGMPEVQKNRIVSLDIDLNQLVAHKDFKLLSDFKNAFKNLDQLLTIYQTSIIRNVVPQKISPLQESEHTIEKDKKTFKHEDNSEPKKQFNPDPLMVGGGGRGGGYGYGGGHGFGSGDSDLYADFMPHIPNTVGPAGFNPGLRGGSNIDRNHPGFGRVHFPNGSDDYHNSGLPSSEFIPRGAVPPGARFDPFGPPTGQPNNRKPSQNNRYGDEFAPPKFDNDFYS